MCVQVTNLSITFNAAGRFKANLKICSYSNKVVNKLKFDRAGIMTGQMEKAPINTAWKEPRIDQRELGIWTACWDFFDGLRQPPSADNWRCYAPTWCRYIEHAKYAGAIQFIESE